VYAGCYARRYEGRYTGVRIGVLQDFMLGGAVCGTLRDSMWGVKQECYVGYYAGCCVGRHFSSN
jgi:hypothetical protein